MRDAAFSRQRYWGEPFPIVWKDGIAYPLDESELPLELPYVEKYGPGPEGEGPLANIDCLDSSIRLKPTLCPAMPGLRGIFSAIWTRTTKLPFAAAKPAITGTRWICILAEPNMP